MKILSFGAGMQSTALALMSCENAVQAPAPYPLVPVYDAVIFCDLGLEPPWVKEQMEFTKNACENAGIPFYVLDISRSRKRIEDLTPADCNDAECFEYCGRQVWNGF